MQKSLTPEQKSEIHLYAEKWVGAVCSPKRPDRAIAEEALGRICQRLRAMIGSDFGSRDVRWEESPLKPVIEPYIHYFPHQSRILEMINLPFLGSSLSYCIKLYLEKACREEIEKKYSCQLLEEIFFSAATTVDRSTSDFRIKGKVMNRISGYVHNYSLVMFDIVRNVLGDKEITEPMADVLIFLEHVCWFGERQNSIILCEKPKSFALDENFNLHNTFGPAVSYGDGEDIYCIHGVPVPRVAVQNPENIPLYLIESCENAEIRRVLISRFGGPDAEGVFHGEENYIRALDLEPIHSDDWGELFVQGFRDDEPITMVRVTNTTPEPDGSHKDYYLLVHPQLRPLHSGIDGMVFGAPQEMTALNAVASTQGFTGEQYLRALRVSS